MIKLMVAAHRGHIRSHDGQTNNYDTMKFVLEIMESHGMMPPPSEREIDGLKLVEWEPEDT